MLNVQRKKRSRRPRRRLWLLGAALLLAASVLVFLLASRPVPEEAPVSHRHGPATLCNHAETDVLRIVSEPRISEGWTLVQAEPGVLCLESDPGKVVSQTQAALLLSACAQFRTADVLTDDPAEYAAHLADFGLADPRARVEIAYADGSVLRLQIGDPLSLEQGATLYLLAEGDDRLFTLDSGTASLFTTDQSLLWDLTQPTLHPDRFDHITLTTPDAVLEWTLQGDVGNSDAEECWFLLQPVRYPADGQRLTLLRDHIGSLLLGAYVCEATPETLHEHGFDSPRLIIEIHQAAGAMGIVSEMGAYDLVDWPESTVTLTVGGAKNADLDYLLWDGHIYTTSHYAIASLMTVDYRDTLSLFPVLTALGNLEQLTIEQNGVITDDFRLVHTEEVARNNELVTDEDGQVVITRRVTRNGLETPFEPFEAAYHQLVNVSVSGELPDDWHTDAEPHTVYTFRDVSGAQHRVALLPYDALHDAVEINGTALFYLIKGGFSLNLD